MKVVREKPREEVRKCTYPLWTLRSSSRWQEGGKQEETAEKAESMKEQEKKQGQSSSLPSRLESG